MEFVVKSGAAEKQKTACLIIGAHKKSLLPSATAIDSITEGYLADVLKRGDLNFKPGHSLMLLHSHHAPFERLLLLAMGDNNKPLTEAEFNQLTTNLASQLRSVNAREVTIAIEEIAVEGKSLHWVTRHVVEAIEYAFYQFDQFKNDTGTSALSKISLKKVILLADRKNAEAVKAGLVQGQAIGNGRNVARTLGNLPGNICHPTYLADEAKALAKKHAKLTTRVLNEKQMSDLGMSSLLSVSAGSEQEARLICMEFKNGKRSARPLVLLGKGITFDTGGISLKPGAAMDEMKFDMCGAASVFGVMNTIIELDLPINVIGMVAAAENMPGGQATRPGDIVTSMSGKTIEILNTDAEGRLVLCDALTYAERYKPEAVIDIATLTGACVVALGHHTTGLLSNHQPLAEELLSASREAMDRAWQLPMGEEYTRQLDSNFADMANIGGPAAGTITAACFLAKFAEAYPWAHLDIAGTAWKSGKEKGATGRPVPMLVQYLLNKI
ncbi:leucyl aminopeptidase [Endozoicomonas sp. SCSIO W0465]|uniref:leucyl aminopeptidase n=1 Tax=Endozoicomonas sp. SCSIO W0465 TaxID=2918516 RepID=UPI002074F2B9|nr:leucyl aminopeptidase [Endozoicomonas sp. SCSIO W0465]USE33836.1 leucyl aminopeptidase [Endozoicomonas sp. SCSIO W0465]